MKRMTVVITLELIELSDNAGVNGVMEKVSKAADHLPDRIVNGNAQCAARVESVSVSMDTERA